MSSAIVEYFEALERLQANKPERLPKDSKTNKDTVALEAGRGRGSIKKSRPEFSKLIKAIEEAANQQGEIRPSTLAKTKDRLASIREKLRSTEDLYKAAIGREILLIRQIEELKEEINSLKCTGGNVVPIQGK